MQDHHPDSMPGFPGVPINLAFIRASYAAAALEGVCDLRRLAAAHSLAAKNGWCEEVAAAGAPTLPEFLQQVLASDRCASALYAADGEWDAPLVESGSSSSSSSPATPPQLRFLCTRAGGAIDVQFGPHAKWPLPAPSSTAAFLAAYHQVLPLHYRIYGRFGPAGCPYSNRAKEALVEAGLAHAAQEKARAAPAPPGTPATHTTVPVVFHGDRFVGGCAELLEELTSG